MSKDSSENEEYSLYINNFKPIRAEEPLQIKLGDFTVIMGQRGVGKSSIMEALHMLQGIYQLYNMTLEEGSQIIDLIVSDKEEYLLKPTVTLDQYIIKGAPKNNEKGELVYVEDIEYPLLLNIKRTYLHDLINKFIKNNEKTLITLCKENNCFGIEIGRGVQPSINILKEKHLESKINVNNVESINPEDFPIIYSLTIERLQPHLADVVVGSGGTIPATLNYITNTEATTRKFLDYLKIQGIGPHGYLLKGFFDLLASRHGSFYEEQLEEIYNNFIKIYNELLENEELSYELEAIEYNQWRNSIMLYFRTYSGETFSVPLSQLSRGTLNALSVMTQVILADYFSKKYNKKYIVAIEEPEATLHSSALFYIIKILIKMKKDNHKLGILLTSHSYRLLAVLQFALSTITEEYKYRNYIYILKQEFDLSTDISEYTFTNFGDVIISSLETLSIDELELIHRILAEGVP